MKFYAYVLRSLRNGRLYVGQTQDLQRRIFEHNSKRVQATRYQGPYEVIYVEIFPSRTDSMRRESFFKTGQGRAELKSISQKT